MDEVLRHCRRYIGQEYDEPYLVSAVPEEVIRSLTPADVVEVIRCRECIHWSDTWEARSIPEAHYCRKMGLFKLPDYYCADGEFKYGGQDE